MLAYFENLDRLVLYFVNHTLQNSWFDLFFPAFTDWHKTQIFQWVFLPFVLLISFYLRRSYGFVINLWALFCMALVIGATDLMGSQVIKPFFQRLRPPEFLPEIAVRAPYAGSFGFISNHSANMFCFATFASFLFPKARWALLTLAAFSAFSRLYVGVHFPSDVIFGALLGVLMGSLGRILYCLPLSKAGSHSASARPR